MTNRKIFYLKKHIRIVQIGEIFTMVLRISTLFGYLFTMGSDDF